MKYFLYSTNKILLFRVIRISKKGKTIVTKNVGLQICKGFYQKCVRLDSDATISLLIFSPMFLLLLNSSNHNYYIQKSLTCSNSSL